MGFKRLLPTTLFHIRMSSLVFVLAHYCWYGIVFIWPNLPVHKFADLPCRSENLFSPDGGIHDRIGWWIIPESPVELEYVDTIAIQIYGSGLLIQEKSVKMVEYNLVQILVSYV